MLKLLGGTGLSKLKLEVETQNFMMSWQRPLVAEPYRLQGSDAML